MDLQPPEGPSTRSTRFEAAFARHSWSAAALAGFAALAAALAAFVLPVETIRDVMREGGPIENATLAAYAAAVYAAWRLEHGAFGKVTAAAVTLLLAACVLKEISLRRPLLVSAGYDPSGFDLTAWPNLLAAAIVIALVPAGAWLVWRYARGMLEGLKDRTAWACTLAVAFACLVVSQALDYLSKADGRQLDLSLSLNVRAVFLSLEEVLELVFPVLIALAAVQLRAGAAAWRRRARKADVRA